MPLVGLGLLVLFVPGLNVFIAKIVGIGIWVGVFLVLFLIVLASALILKKISGGIPQPGMADSDEEIDPENAPESDPDSILQDQLRAIDWFQFEKLIAFAYSGTCVITRKGGANPDGGIDIFLERQGERVGIQCKHWKSWTVGVKVVREMIGALADAGLKKGIIVSLNSYSQDAIKLAGRHNIELVDEQGIVELIRYLDQREVQAILSDTKKFCPRCEREMVLRTAGHGKNEGAQFWGCSGYPRCHQTLPFERVN